MCNIKSFGTRCKVGVCVFRFIDQQLSIDHLVKLDSWNALAYFQSCHLYIQFCFVHKISYRKDRTDCFSIFTIEQDTSLFIHQLVYLSIYLVKVYNDRYIFIDRHLNVSFKLVFEIRNFLLLSVIDEIDHSFYLEIV